MNIEFPVTIYGKMEKFSDTISRARVRIFYKGLNRNATYISEEFADKLISTLPYAPIKGIYDADEVDYTDHGKERTEGRIYGVVPADNNFAWETHTDEDGVERTYACADVLLYTALYKEATQINGKSQSMEIYGPSIKGNWTYMSGKKVFKFEYGCFLGLQVLGDEVEPCFEGAAFFSTYKQVEDIYEKLKEYKTKIEKGGNKPMDMINFKLSDRAKFDAVWNLLNIDYYNAENDWAVRYSICDIYDEYAVCYDYSDGSYLRQYYTKNDESDSIELGEKKKCYILDVTEEEKAALNALHAINNGTYEKIDEAVTELKTQNETLITENSNLNENYTNAQAALDEANGKVEAHEATINELNEQINSYTSQVAELNSNIETLTSEKDTLIAYKLQQEANAKRAIVDTYSDRLSEDVIKEYTDEKLVEFTAEALEKELCYKLVKTNPNVFSNNSQPQYIPKTEGPKGGLDEILSKYKN